MNYGEMTFNVTWLEGQGFQRGDRVRVKDGYDRAGCVGWYWSKSLDCADAVVIDFDKPQMGTRATILAAAIEPYHTREERIERAIEDFEALYAAKIGANSFRYDYAVRAALYAILDAGV